MTRIKYIIDDDEFQQLYSYGLNNKQIAERLKIPHYTVCQYMKKRNIRSNRSATPLQILDNGAEAICSKCSQIKSIDQYQYGRKGYKYEYRFSYCNSCRKQQSYACIDRNIETYLKNRCQVMKSRCKRKGILFTLTSKDLINLYHKQDGLCFYTDIEMVWKTLNGNLRHTISVDKIHPDEGYVLSNIVLCTHKANTIKSDISLQELQEWIPGWYQRLLMAGKI